MKTKKQKQQIIEKGLDLVKNNQNLIFIDFTGVKTKDLNNLRELLKEKEVYFQVFKKRLFNLIFQKSNFSFPLEQIEGQLGVVFVKNSEQFQEICSLIYNYIKNNKNNLKILGGYSLFENKYLENTFVQMLGSLPSKEILLGQFVFLLTSPLRKLMFILNEKSKRS